MRELMQRIYLNPRYARIFEWGKLISITGSAQLLVQATAFVAGILIIRMLPQHEYALYTVVNTMLGTMLVLTDGGIRTGVMSLGARVWQDKSKLGAVLTTGMHLRNTFSIGSLLVSVPILVILLRQHSASWLVTILLVVSILPAFFTALSGAILEVGPELHQDITPLQKIQVVSNLSRLVILALTILVFPFAFIAILCSGIPQIWANIRLRKLSAKYIDHDAKVDPVVKKDILRVSKKLFPGAIYYCISGQITMWLISVFGSTASIAELGALGRLGTLLTVLTAIITTLVVPRFSKLSANRPLLLKRFFQMQIILIGVGICIVTVVYFFPTQILFILGKEYLSLSTELLLMIISSCIAMLAGVSYAMSVSRQYIISPVLYIAIDIIVQAILIFSLDLSIVKNVLVFSIITTSVIVLMFWSNFLYHIYNEKFNRLRI